MAPPLCLEPRDEGFDLFWGGLLVVSHRKKRPFLRAGRGRGQYSGRHGSLKVRDLELELHPCSEVEVLDSSPGKVRLGVTGFGACSFTLEGESLFLRFEPEAHDLNRLVLSLAARPRERIYGCGEQYSFLDLRGQRLPILCEEQGVGRGANLVRLAAELSAGAGGTRFSTYYPLPVFLSSDNWSCSCGVSAYASFDFRRRREHRLSFWEIPEEIRLDAAPSMRELVGRLSTALGRQPCPPDWAFEGLIMGAQGGTAEVLRKLGVMRGAGAPVAAIWAQDWCGRRLTSFGSQLMWNWETETSMYPELPATIKGLETEGIRFLGYVNPFLAADCRLYREASEKGLCVKAADGSDYLVTVTSFPAAMLDLSNPAAVEWIKGVIKDNMLGAGLSGWMADFGEYLPMDAVLFSGESAEKQHNRYPVEWARANREALVEAGREDDCLFFVRAGHSGTTRHAPSIWAGDQLVDWCRDDGLPSVLPAALSLGLQGGAFFHADLGGYTTAGWVKRSRELLLRWAELAAFMPVMRSHEGNRPAANAQMWDDPELAGAVARMARVHAALAPYTKALAREYAETGIPLLRPLFLECPGDRRCADRPYEFFYGPDLLVAPVLRKGARRRRLYLPEGEWLELWTGRRMAPGWRTVAAPLGRPPVFWRADSTWRGLFGALAASAGPWT